MSRIEDQPEWFIQVCYLYEFREGRTAREARDNLPQTMQLMMEVREELDALNIETIQLPWPSVYLPPPEQPEAPRPHRSSIDSDNCEIIEEDEGLQRVNRLFEEFARGDVSNVGTTVPRTLLKELPEILKIRRIAPSEECSQEILFPHKYIQVLVEPRKITITVSETDPDEEEDSDSLSIVYESCPEGCWVYCRDKKQLHIDAKYQSMAAREFFHLIRHPNQGIKKMHIINRPREIDGNQRIWPFTKFYWKIQKYLATLGRLISVETLDFEFFEFPNHRTSDQAMVLAIFQYLRVPNQLKMRCVSRVTVELNPLFTRCMSWRVFRHLDIQDERFLVRDYHTIFGIDRVSIYLPETEMVSVVMAAHSYIPPAGYPWNITLLVQHSFSFDEACAIQSMINGLKQGIRLNYTRGRRMWQITIHPAPQAIQFLIR
uniref:Tudor domain-containing protein n=1 Tax=Caenorhabditis tropicalis TaxID=1561998 RepID=A0A1I7UIP6_9PELO